MQNHARGLGDPTAIADDFSSVCETLQIASAVESPDQVFLMIDTPAALSMIVQLIPQPAIVLARYVQLDEALLTRVKPDCIVMPLMAARFDVMQALDRLIDLGYAQSVCVLAPPLPNPAMIRAELRVAAQGMDLVMLELPESQMSYL